MPKKFCNICGSPTIPREQHISSHIQVGSGLVFLSICGSSCHDYCLSCLRKYGTAMIQNLPEALPTNGDIVVIEKRKLKNES